MQVFLGKRSGRWGVLVGVLAAVGMAAAPAGANPVDPLEADRGATIQVPGVHASPTGEQMLSYKRGDTDVSQPPLGAAARTDGGPFGPFEELTQTPNSEPPSIAFGPNGDAYAIWGIATSGAAAQQTLRPAGQTFEPATNFSGCGRFVDADVSFDGRLSVSCSFTLALFPPNRFRTSIAPEISRIVSMTDVIPLVTDDFIRPQVAWGGDGTVVTAADHSDNFAPVPPDPEPGRITARIQGPTFTETLTVDTAINMFQLGMNDLTVLSDGTTVVTGEKEDEAKIWIRDPGPGNAFFNVTLPGKEAESAKEDGNGTVHVLSTLDADPPQATVSIRSTSGLFGAQIPVPLIGSDSFIRSGGFQVTPDGTEYVVMRDGETVAVARRPAGSIAFEQPVTIADGIDQGPDTVMTAEGDLLVAWTELADPDTKVLMVGGWDEGPPALDNVEVPSSGLLDAELTFSAQASDPMGLRSIRWDFGDGQTAEGGTVQHTYRRPGSFQVRVTAIDRAGNETVADRTVTVPEGNNGPDGRLQLRVGTPKKLKFRAFARKGVRVRASSNQALRIRVRIGTSKRALNRKALGARSARALKKRHVIRVKPKRTRLGKRRNLRLFVRVTGTTAEGERVKRVKRVRIQR